MTTHYEKIQALGNKMASNLTAMGVSASFNDGGLTLADKILDINHFEDGLLLSSSKLIAQASNTIYFTALLLENKTFKSGESVLFKSDNLIPFTYTSFNNINKELGTSFTVKCTEEDVQLNFKDDDGRYWLNYDPNSGFGILMDGSTILSSFSGGNSTISFENGVFSTNGQTVDYSAYFNNVLLRDALPDQSASSVVVYCDVLGIEDTNSYGIATVPLVCSGSGKHTITAKSGSVVSQPYTVIDALLYDVATSEDTTKWLNQGVTASYSDENGTTISQDTDYRYQSKYSMTNDLAIEFDVYIPSTSTSAPTLYVRGIQPSLLASDFPRNTWHTCKVECKYVEDDSEDKPYHYLFYSNGTYLYTTKNTSANAIFQFRVTDAELTFKNFRIYPI